MNSRISMISLLAFFTISLKISVTIGPRILFDFYSCVDSPYFGLTRSLRMLGKTSIEDVFSIFTTDSGPFTRF